MSLAYRILGTFINQPTSFVGTRKCSISSLIPSSTCISLRVHPLLPPTACIKPSHCHKNQYHMTEVENLHQKTSKETVNK